MNSRHHVRSDQYLDVLYPRDRFRTAGQKIGCRGCPRRNSIVSLRIRLQGIAAIGETWRHNVHAYEDPGWVGYHDDLGRPDCSLKMMRSRSDTDTPSHCRQELAPEDLNPRPLFRRMRRPLTPALSSPALRPSNDSGPARMKTWLLRKKLAWPAVWRLLF